jgi:hypothetical protein
MHNPHRTTVYSFPVQVPESIYFIAKGAVIDKAILMANDIKLSIIEPVYEASPLGDEPTNLAFFDELPFHNALAADWKVQILLYIRGDRVPSISFVLAKTTLRWADIPGSSHIETVTVGSDKGKVTRRFMYMRHIGGYIKEEAGERAPSGPPTDSLSADSLSTDIS